VSLLEFCLLVPIILYRRRKGGNIKDYIKKLILKKFLKKKTLLFLLISLAIAFMMFLISSPLMLLLDHSTGLIFGSKAKTEAIENMNSIELNIISRFDLIFFY